MGNFANLVPLGWAILGAVIVAALWWVFSPAEPAYNSRSWGSAPSESRLSQAIGFAPVIYWPVAAVLVVALIASCMLTVAKIYGFFDQFWPFSWVWATILLLFWVPCLLASWYLGRTLLRSGEWDESTTWLATLTLGVSGLTGIFMTIGQWITAVNHALAPITVGGLLFLGLFLVFLLKND